MLNIGDDRVEELREVLCNLVSLHRHEVERLRL